MTVAFAPAAEKHLLEIYEWIATAGAPKAAQDFISAIIDFCERLADTPRIGADRDDIRPGLRTIGFRRRAVIAFHVDEGDTVTILGVHYGGRDYEPLLAHRD